MIITIGSDHGGFDLKQKLVGRLEEKGHEILDKGCHSTDAVDYPDIAAAVAGDIVSGKAERGILVCGTGIGMSNAVSRFDGIIAALCTNAYMAKMSRLHNDANVLCLGGRVIGDELAWEIVSEFIKGDPLVADKYVRRRSKVDSLPGEE